jgi:hypothetical protein
MDLWFVIGFLDVAKLLDMSSFFYMIWGGIICILFLSGFVKVFPALFIERNWRSKFLNVIYRTYQFKIYLTNLLLLLLLPPPPPYLSEW